MALKKHGGIREIIESGQAPGMYVKGTRKNGDDPHDYAPEHRTPISIEAEQAGLTPEQYERIQERSVASAEKRAAEVAKDRRGTRRKDGEIRHIGSVPTAEFYAEMSRDRTKGTWYGSDGKEVRKKLKEKGRLFKHEEE